MNKIVILFIVLIYTSISLFSEGRGNVKERSNGYFINDYFNPPFIFFDKNSYELSDKSKKYIDSLVTYCNEEIQFFDKYYMVLTATIVKDEFVKDPYIGLKRCSAVIKYIEWKFKIDSRSFYIADSYTFSIVEERPEVHFSIIRRR